MGFASVYSIFVSRTLVLFFSMICLEYYRREVARDQNKTSDCTMIYMVIIFLFDV